MKKKSKRWENKSEASRYERVKLYHCPKLSLVRKCQVIFRKAHTIILQDMQR